MNVGWDLPRPATLGEGCRPLFFAGDGHPLDRGLPRGVLYAMGTPERDPAFLQRVDDLIDDLTTRFDEFDPDEVEAETSGGVLKLTFADQTRCVLNRQAAANQVWLAEGATAWHFEWQDQEARWMDTKGRGELRSILASIVAGKLGRAVDLAGAEG
jgi:CyaY protein